jgi:hypothetical protein
VSKVGTVDELFHFRGKCDRHDWLLRGYGKRELW